MEAIFLRLALRSVHVCWVFLGMLTGDWVCQSKCFDGVDYLCKIWSLLHWRQYKQIISNMKGQYVCCPFHTNNCPICLADCTLVWGKSMLQNLFTRTLFILSL